MKIYGVGSKYYQSDYERLQKINIDSYVSPIKLLFVNDDFNGYLMKYCTGEDLDRTKLNIKLSSFIRDFKKLYDDTEKLSEIGFVINDLYLGNIMYDNGFKIIDLDDYIYEKNDSFEEIYSKNIFELNSLMVDMFIKNTGLQRLFVKNSKFIVLKNMCKWGGLPFEEFVYNILEYTKKNSDEDINKIGDIGKILVKKNSKF